MFSIKLIDNYEDFIKIESLWEKMVDFCEFPTIFQLYSWCKVWWNVYGKDKKLFILIVKKNSIPIGLAPLMLSGHSKKLSVEFIGTGNADYTDFFINPEFKKDALECIFDFLFQNKKKWKKISLSQMSERTGSIESIKKVLLKYDYSFRLKEIEQCHTFEYFNESEEREKFESGLNKIKNLRNSVNFFKKRGIFCYESNKNKEIISKKLPELFFLHWKRWENTYTPSKFINFRDREFYYEITKELCGNSNVSLEEINVNSKSIAYIYSYLYKKTIYLYTACFDVFYKKKSPSIILLYYIIENYIKNGYFSIDFGRGGEQYKEKMTNKSYANYEIVVYKNIVEYKVMQLLFLLKENELCKIINSALINLIKINVQTMIRSHGLFNAAIIAIRSILHKLVEHKRISVCEFENLISDLNFLSSDFKFVEISRDNADEIAAFYGFEMKSENHEIISQRFLENNYCFGLKYNNMFIAMCFVNFYPFNFLLYDKEIIFENNDAVLSDVVIIPEFCKNEVIYSFYAEVVKKIKSMHYRVVMVDTNKFLLNYIGNAHCCKIIQKYNVFYVLRKKILII